MFLDFIEIGTSDFNTLIQAAGPDTHGLSIDPISLYLDRLPNRPGCKKINAAISNFEGTVEVYFIPPQVIAKHRLPNWLRGCNSIGAPHPTVSKQLEKMDIDPELVLVRQPVPCHRLQTVLHQHDVQGVFMLKVDTEGHDAVILNDFFDDATPQQWPHQIVFESNKLSDSETIHRLIAKLILMGYDIVSCETGGGASDTHLRLNLNRLKGERTTIQTAKGYYLEGYPKNYSPLNLPHENNLDSALEYAHQQQAAGVTFQYGRYEVRQGRYLHHSVKDLKVQSWMRLPETSP
ncbi:MAG: FkbM family methyltransferase [Gammaproteobacteria bacterium]|uniref:FkbM family methyltransferase n=1 Tax=Limnobacter sp. CACIAM 66H1 TaxID=1813033 RepID=UPI0025C1BFE8|nr:FkbM family methyltransferase [Limnobacter sp. CACIAM 66H1]MBU0542192.1 FkbM family methyltransferase [Gammaproteobacteria bacterium]